MSLQSLRVMVVDDHALFRRGLIGLLADLPEFEVVGEAGSGQEALDLLREIEVDLLILDVNMPGMDGLATLEAIRKERRLIKVVMLTISQHEADLLTAIRSGADGYLLKNTELEDLRKILLRVAGGEGVLSPEVTPTVFKALVRSVQEAPLLSERELDVLDCLSKGLTTQKIGAALFISENTVKTHVRHILEKLEAANRSEAISKALQMGILPARE